MALKDLLVKMGFLFEYLFASSAVYGPSMRVPKASLYEYQFVPAACRRTHGTVLFVRASVGEHTELCVYLITCGICVPSDLAGWTLLGPSSSTIHESVPQPWRNELFSALWLLLLLLR